MSAEFVARKRLVLFGVRYERQERVDLTRVSPVLRRRLIEQKRVVPRAAAGAAAGTAASEVEERHPDARPDTCGWFGGLKADGTPCGWVSKSRPCRFHRTEG